MTDERRSDVDPDAEEAPYRSPEEVAATGHPEVEFPNLGRGGDMTGDEESLARRPPQDEDEIDGDTETDEKGTPPGTATHGA